MRINRRAFISCSLVGLAAVPAYAKFVESGWLELTRNEIPVAGLERPIRVLHLSDLHAGDHTPFSVVASAVAMGLGEHPDLVCLTGDYLTFGEFRYEADYRSVLAPLVQAAPVYAILGNHDGGPWAASHSGVDTTDMVRGLLESVGIVFLRNEAIVAGNDGCQFNLVGLGDLWAGDWDADRAFGAVSRPELPTVLMAHNPDLTSRLGRYRWELQLSGHTHGGQLVVPGFGPPYVPVEDNRFIRGLCPYEGRWVYVTRGVGAIYGVRFDCRPEVSILDLVPA